jgi:hypothetical protein
MSAGKPCHRTRITPGGRVCGGGGVLVGQGLSISNSRSRRALHLRTPTQAAAGQPLTYTMRLVPSGLANTSIPWLRPVIRGFEFGHVRRLGAVRSATAAAIAAS